MPSIRVLASRAGISPNVFRTIVNDCIPSHCSQYIIPSLPIASSDTYLSIPLTNQDSLIQIVQNHYNNHRIHHRGNRNSLRVHTTLADVLNERSRRHVATPPDLSSEERVPGHSRDEREIGIGCDPEFEVWNHEANSQERFRYGNSSSIVGVDGDGVTGELRPRWSKDPVKVFQTIDSLMNTVAEHVSTNCSVVAGEGKFKSTGGHIHISGLGENAPRDLITALDTFIARPLSDRCNGHRKNSGYNGLSLVRRQENRFEYRSPASWLAHPVLTKGALVIASVLSNEKKLRHSLPSTNDDLLDRAPNAEERSAIEMFYMFLDNTAEKGIFLEELDVLRVWGKRKPQAVISQRTPNSASLQAATITRSAIIGDSVPVLEIPEDGRFRVICNNDTNMPQDLTWHRNPEVSFVGAGVTRENNTIFLPNRLENRAMEISERFLCNVMSWELGSIGISRDFRADPIVVRRIITTILEVIVP